MKQIYLPRSSEENTWFFSPFSSVTPQKNISFPHKTLGAERRSTILILQLKAQEETQPFRDSPAIFGCVHLKLSNYSSRSEKFQFFFTQIQNVSLSGKTTSKAPEDNHLIIINKSAMATSDDFYICLSSPPFCLQRIYHQSY